MSIILYSLRSIPSNTKIEGKKKSYYNRSFSSFSLIALISRCVMVKSNFQSHVFVHTWNAFSTSIPCSGVLWYGFLICHSNLIFTIQDLKYEENSVKAVQCLNDMVTNALIHAEDCLIYMAALKDLAIFRFCAIPQVLFVYSVTSDLTVI